MQDDVTQMQRIHDLEQEILRLRRLLTQAGISYALPLREEVITPQHALFSILFSRAERMYTAKGHPEKMVHRHITPFALISGRKTSVLAEQEQKQSVWIAHTGNGNRSDNGYL